MVMAMGMGIGTGRIVLAAAAVALAVATAAAPAAAQTLTVIAFSDVDQITTNDGRGGLDRIAAVIRAEREAAGEERRVLAVHAGDALSPSVLSGFDEGAHMVDVLNRVGIDVFVPGNHEFDFGPDVFRQRMAALETRKLSANIRDSGGGPLAGFEPTQMIDVGGVRVGLVGVTTERTTITSSPGDLAFLPAVATAVNVAREMRAEGADFVIAIAHVSGAEDRQLVRSGEFDMIVSGDDHALAVLWDGRTALLQSREQGDHVPIADVSFAVSGEGADRRVSFAPAFRVVDTSAVAPDPTLAEVVQRHLDALDRGLSEVVATAGSSLDTRRATVRTTEAAFGNLVADAMRAAMEADFALQNGGGIRADRVYLADAPITRRDVFAELPFGNTVVLLEITGADLVAALENGFSQLGGTPGRFPQIAGGRVVVDPSRPVGQRLVTFTVGGEPVDPAATYRLATNDFLYRGGDGYESLARARAIVGPTDGPLLATVVADHLEGLGTVNAAPEGRITFR